MMNKPKTEIKLHYGSTVCPHCDANLVGHPIPEKDQEVFGGKTHFSRLIGIETEDYDGISFWKCPDCGMEDSRWGL